MYTIKEDTGHIFDHFAVEVDGITKIYSNIFWDLDFAKKLCEYLNRGFISRVPYRVDIID